MALDSTIAARRRAKTGGAVIKKSRSSSRSAPWSPSDRLDRVRRWSQRGHAVRRRQRQAGQVDKKKWKLVALFTGVRTEVAGGVNGLQSNPTTSAPRTARTSSSIPRRLGLRDAAAEREHSGAGARCSPRGLTTAPGRRRGRGPRHRGDRRPHRLGLLRPRGEGHPATHRQPDAGPGSAGRARIPGQVERGQQDGLVLSVPHAPETGALMITKFNATITKSSGGVLAAARRTGSSGSAGSPTTTAAPRPPSSSRSARVSRGGIGAGHAVL